jgi:hypothetical protein
MWLIMRLFGFDDPVPDVFKHIAARFKGEPVSWTLECPNGYLMFRFHFANDSTLDFRDFPRRYRSVAKSED